MRFFSSLGFLKSKLRNKPNKNFETCLRVRGTTYNVKKIPFERALIICSSICERIGLCKTSNTSSGGIGNGTNDSDTMNSEFETQGEENEDQTQNQDVSFTLSQVECQFEDLNLIWEIEVN
jgi:hypothetical protein